jgi:undecaprenyl-diphosphatase
VNGLSERTGVDAAPGLWRVFLLSGLSLLVFFLLLLALFHHGTVGIDRWVARAVSGLPASVYLFFSVLCRSGNAEIELPVLLVLGLRLRKRSPETVPLLLFLFSVLILGTLMEHLLKMHLPRYSPPDLYQHDPLTGWEIFFPAHFHVIASFPSGHTFRALLILLLVRLLYPRAFVPVLLWAFGIIVGVIVLGWHWNSDTWGSIALVGAVWPWAQYLDRQIKKS